MTHSINVPVLFISDTKPLTQWFTQELVYNIYKTYQQKDPVLGPDMPFFYGSDSNLDFVEIPSHLQELAQPKAMLISSVHMHVRIFRFLLLVPIGRIWARFKEVETHLLSWSLKIFQLLTETNLERR
jgi:hypothetical protein